VLPVVHGVTRGCCHAFNFAVSEIPDCDVQLLWTTHHVDYIADSTYSTTAVQRKHSHQTNTVPAIQGVPGGKDLTSGECSLGQNITI